MMESPRSGRTRGEMRQVVAELGASPMAEGSCLIAFGGTRVLCAASVQESVPEWRAGQGAGWVTAEYAMLPRATSTRTDRERTGIRGRTQEIQRLIGRSLRAAVDLRSLGERTIIVDCDVITADGGTRTAAITGGMLALHQACGWLSAQGRIASDPIRDLVAAVSVGVVNGEARVDLDYPEDSRASVDLNLVGLESGGFVEVQGTGERSSFSREELTAMLDLGTAALTTLFTIQRGALGGSE